jgi:hypothetical protein
VSRKFSLGQTVWFTPGGFEVLEAAASGTITRLLPKEEHGYQYHVRIDADGANRRANENQLGLRPPVQT